MIKSLTVNENRATSTHEVRQENYYRNGKFSNGWFVRLQSDNYLGRIHAIRHLACVRSFLSIGRCQFESIDWLMGDEVDFSSFISIYLGRLTFTNRIQLPHEMCCNKIAAYALNVCRLPFLYSQVAGKSVWKCTYLNRSPFVCVRIGLLGANEQTTKIRTKWKKKTILRCLA